MDADEASWASPPAAGIVSTLEPLLVDADAALLDILTMVLAQVVAEVITTTERLAGAGTSWVVAIVCLLGRIEVMNVPIVALKIGSALEGLNSATSVEAYSSTVLTGGTMAS